MKFLLLTSLILLSSGVKAQCSGNEPVIDLGADTILCSGQPLNLSVPAGYDAYNWSDGSSGTTINVTSDGTYSVEAILYIGNTNLVTNGDFENGDTGFTSDYGSVQFTSPTALWDPGYYAVGNSPNDYHSNFYSCTDHSSGSGKMYIANGASSANTKIWTQTISVQPNTNYSFSAWVSSVENTSAPAVLQFFVNGTQIGDVFSPSTIGCEWDEFFNIWNSGNSSSAVISIVNQNTEASGNDFALDDISFIPYCTNRDTIIVSFESITVNAGSDVTICSDSTATLNAVSSVPNTIFSWNNSVNGPAMTPTSSGTYTVTGTSPNGCTDNDQVNFTINPVPDATFTTSASEVQIPKTLDFELLNPVSAANYSWTVNNNPEANTGSFSYDFTETGLYTIALHLETVAGCSSDFELTVKAFDVTILETANIFTPNGDGDNDLYHFNMQNIKSIDLHIFNRWGQEVAQIAEVKQGWDGKDFEGKELSPGIYFYIYSAEAGSDGKMLSGQGFIHLVR